ncbi:pyridoxal-phosphate dependent enzyme [Streptomyces sp. NBC_00075]|uniref:threonine ammonia-lyase n=1 Tax=Streptomyces sp. NBC_00093 TaxID=2975649 RepID=A0AAU2AH10_9ACTN
MSIRLILGAVDNLRGIAVRTPMLTSAALNEQLGRTVWVKAENQQLTGSFKLRGAYNALALMDAETRSRGVVGASSGNHAAALALAAHRLEVPVTVVVPENLPSVKRQAIEDLGARIVPYGRLAGRRDALVHEIADRGGLTIVPSANDEQVIAGAGTVGWEMLQEHPDLTALVVPVGGGGLAAGTALAASAHNPGPRVFGAEPATADDTHRSLQAGRRISIAPPRTIADGLGHTEPARIPFHINQRLLAGVVTVPEGAISEAMAHLWRLFRLVAEPSGAVAFAGLLHALGRLPDGPVGVVVSGGNVDWNTYKTQVDTAMTRWETPLHAAAVLH